VLEVGNAEGNAFEHSNLAVHAFNEAAGDVMMEEIDDLSLPGNQCVTKGVKVLHAKPSGIRNPCIKRESGLVRRSLRFIPVMHCRSCQRR
jgi:hypothetical protein